MRNACEKWKDELLEAALTGAVTKDLEEHLQSCQNCGAELEELKARRTRLDALLPLVGQGAQPPADFRARVLAAAESDSEGKGVSRWRAWKLAWAMVAAAAVLALGVPWYHEKAARIPAQELATAEKLAEWRAPSDTLLATPGQDLLRTTPKLGGTYLSVPANQTEEE